MRKATASLRTRILKIDLDLIVDKAWLTHYRRNVQLVLSSYSLAATVIRITPSRRKGYHVRIYLDKSVSAHNAVLLQWLLCDDHARVDFNRARVNAGFDEWNKFHE
jgi:hypothetical protein